MKLLTCGKRWTVQCAAPKITSLASCILTKEVYSTGMNEATKQPDYVKAYSEQATGPDRCYHCKQLLTPLELNKPLERIWTAPNDWNTGRFCKACAEELSFT